MAWNMVTYLYVLNPKIPIVVRRDGQCWMKSVQNGSVSMGNPGMRWILVIFILEKWMISNHIPPKSNAMKYWRLVPWTAFGLAEGFGGLIWGVPYEYEDPQEKHSVWMEGKGLIRMFISNQALDLKWVSLDQHWTTKWRFPSTGRLVKITKWLPHLPSSRGWLSLVKSLIYWGPILEIFHKNMGCVFIIVWVNFHGNATKLAKCVFS